LGSQCGSDWRVKTLQETAGGVLENIIDRRFDAQLRELNQIGADPKNWGGRIALYVTIAVEVARGKDLRISQVCKRGRSKALGCAISVAMEL
jgi:hypothetical protein